MGATFLNPYSQWETSALKKFLRCFQKTHAHLDSAEAQRLGESAWGKLSLLQKKHFEVKSSQPPKKSAIKRRKPTTKQKRAVYSLRNQAKKKTSFKATKRISSPVIGSAFMSFLREYQKMNDGLDMRKRLKRGARQWSKLTKEEQKNYRPIFKRVRRK